MTPTEEDIARACRNAARRRAGELIADLHDLDKSRRGGAFNSPSLGKARDYIEMAMSELEDGEEEQPADLPYTHHGPTVYGSKLADYMVSEAMMMALEREISEGATE